MSPAEVPAPEATAPEATAPRATAPRATAPRATAPLALFNWSGGKDSALCLHRVRQSGAFGIDCLLTSVNEAYGRVSQHGVRIDLLERQAASIGLPLHKLVLPAALTMGRYDALMRETLSRFRERGVTTSVFGDIFLEELRAYREARLAEAGFAGAFPLWKADTRALGREFIDLGFRAVVACVDEKHLDASFAGREFDRAFLDALPAGVDPCGEHGEFHTFVYDGPLFRAPIRVARGEVVYRTYAPAADDVDGGADAGTGRGEEGVPVCPPLDPALPVTGFWYQDLLSN
jgi:uncharacterized protein (TIGR00290 family)